MKTTVKVEGLRDLERALGELPKSTGKNVLRRVGRAALASFDEAWRARAPHLSGQLEESGGVGSKLTRSQRQAHERQSSVEIFAGPGPQPQAVQQEFGNHQHPAQPFMRPAWDETKDQVLEHVKASLGDEIQKAAERLAKREAKKAAKGG